MYASYQKLAKFYDSMHKRRDYDKESGFVLKRIKELNPKAKSIVDVGCGTGTHLDIFSNSFDVLAGVVLNSEILGIAKSKVPSATFLQDSMQDFKLNREFDALISLYSVFNYNLTVEEAETTLRNMNSHLVRGGVLLIALYYAKNLERRVTIHVGKDDGLESAKINDYVYDPDTKVETSSFVLFWKENGKVDFTTENNHKFRIFELSEIEDLLKKTGFATPKFYDGYTDKPVTEKSSYPILITQKI